MMDLNALFQQHGISVPSMQPDRYYTTCPKCSAGRKGAHRKQKVLGVTIHDDDTVCWGCNHCGWTGPEKGSGTMNSQKPNGSRPDQNIYYDYHDEDGNLLFQKVRGPDKTFWLRRPDGKGGWINKLGDTRKVIYRLPDVIDAIASGHPIYIVEGEKDADNLRRLNVPATCNPDGASEPGSKPKWRTEYSNMLRGAELIVIPDNDAAGRAHADAIVKASTGIAASVRLLDIAKHWSACPPRGDISDWLAAGHTREQFDALPVEATKQDEREPDSKAEPAFDWRSKTTKARDLCNKKFPELRFILPGLVPEGVTLLAARPKIGKTWLLQQIATAVSGNPETLGVEARQGDVLCLNLEDGDRRAQSRMTKYFGSNEGTWPERLTFASAWRRLDQGGIDDLRDWCKSVKEPTLITIDTLKRVRPARGRNQTDYDADYEACRPLIDLCHEFPGLAIIVAHHDRKAGANDVFDTVSGTLGLTGGVDAIAMIKRNPQGLTFHVEGRDLPDTIEKVIEFDRETCRWQLLGDLSAIAPPDAKGRIIAALTTSGQSMSADALMNAAGMRNRSSLDSMLSRMHKAGEITRVQRGMYAI